MLELAAVILAAGQGTRLKSDLPKVLHRVCGRPMVLWSVHSARSVGAEALVLVVGYGAEDVQRVVGPHAEYAHQAERLGTGHAVMHARQALAGRARAVLVLYGDMPTLRTETLQRMVSLHAARRPAITMLTAESDDSMGFGRVVRNACGQVQAVVEEAVASPEILGLRELNCGVYCFDADWLWRRIVDIPVTQPKGEYYLTDMVELAVRDGLSIEVVSTDDVTEVQGINTRIHLAMSERILRDRVNAALMLDGVTLVDPQNTYVDVDVRVGHDTIIHPNAHLSGKTVVGARCTIGPSSVLRDTIVGDDCSVFYSVLEGARLENHVEIGPFGHLRPGAHLGEGVHMGNFGEVKNAYLGPGTKMGHFSYVGDAEVGADVNIGAGTVTCNYDGARKHRTVIEAGAFVGSGTMLVAPVCVGAGAKVGAGSVVTHDVPAQTLSYGTPARPRRRLDNAAEEDADGAG